MGALPLFQEGGSVRKYESGRPVRFPSRERPLTLFKQFDIFLMSLSITLNLAIELENLSYFAIS